METETETEAETEAEPPSNASSALTLFILVTLKFETRVTSNETRDKKITSTIPYAMLCVSVYLPRYSFKIRGFQSLHPTAKS